MKTLLRSDEEYLLFDPDKRNVTIESTNEKPLSFFLNFLVKQQLNVPLTPLTAFFCVESRVHNNHVFSTDISHFHSCTMFLYRTKGELF